MKNILLLFAILLAGVVNAQNFSFRCVDIETCEGLVTETFSSGLGTATNNEGYAISIPKATAIKYADGPVITAESLANANTIDISYKGVVYTVGFFSGFGFDTYYYRNDTLGALLVAEGVGTDFNTPFNLDIGPGIHCVDETTPVKGIVPSWWSGNTTDFRFPTFVTKHDNKYLHVGGRYYEMNGNGFPYGGGQVFQLPFNIGEVVAPGDYEMVTYDDITFSQRSLITDVITTHYDAPGTQAGESVLYHIRPDDVLDQRSGDYWQLVGDNKAIQSSDFQGFKNTFYSYDVFEAGSGVRTFLVARNAPPAAVVAGIEYTEAFSSLPDDINGVYSHTQADGVTDNTFFEMDEDWLEGDLFNRRIWLEFNNRYFELIPGFSKLLPNGKYRVAFRGIAYPSGSTNVRITASPNESTKTQMVLARPTLITGTDGSLGRMQLTLVEAADTSKIDGAVWQYSDNIASNDYYQSASGNMINGNVSFVNIFIPYTRPQLDGETSWYYVSEANPSGLKGSLAGYSGAPVAIAHFSHTDNAGHSHADTRLEPLTREVTWGLQHKNYLKIGNRWIYMDSGFDRSFDDFGNNEQRFVVQGYFLDEVERYENNENYDESKKAYYVMGRDMVPVADVALTHYAVFDHQRDDNSNTFTVESNNSPGIPNWWDLKHDAIWGDNDNLNNVLYFQHVYRPEWGSFPADTAHKGVAYFNRTDDKDGVKFFDDNDCGGGELDLGDDAWLYYSRNPWNPAINDRNSCIPADWYPKQ